MKPGNVRCMDCRCEGGSTCPGEHPNRQAEWAAQCKPKSTGRKKAHVHPSPWVAQNTDCAKLFREKHELKIGVPFKTRRNNTVSDKLK